MLCRSCGTRVDCPSCSASLVVHGDRLQCHHCGCEQETPESCAHCGSEDMAAFGPGTRRVAEEVREIFPNARLAVADSDAVTTATQMAELVDRVANERVDVVVGTQMMTKGHHFPKLTTVVVVDADMGLAQGDLTAAERTFQLLTQVAGRAGRAQFPGKVWIQSFDPDHGLFTALKSMDRDGFYAEELKARQAWGDPPFGRQVALIVSGAHEQMVMKASHAFNMLNPQEPYVSTNSS